MKIGCWVIRLKVCACCRVNMAAIVFVLIVIRLCWTVAQSNTQPPDVGAHNASNNQLGLCELREYQDGHWQFIWHKNKLFNQETPANKLWTSHCKVFDTSGIEVSFKGNPLEDYRDNITSINFTHSNIATFRSDFFCYFPHLQYLYLSYNRLDDTTKLGLNLSYDCSINHCGDKLQELHLNGNPLRTIKNNSFCQLERLTYLNLEDCEVAVIESAAFIPIKRFYSVDITGRYVTYWAYCQPTAHRNRPPNNNYGNYYYYNYNYYYSYHKPYFHLRLKNNAITSVRKVNFAQCHNTYELDLSHNAISNIEEAAFNTTNGLEWLDLSNNQLKSLNNVFLNAHIGRLVLNYNQLTAIELSDFSGIRELHLRGNRITKLSYYSFGVDQNRMALHTIDLSNNNLIKLRGFILPRSVKSIILENNQIDLMTFSFPYDLDVRNGIANLQYVNCQNNNFTIVPQMPYSCISGDRVAPVYDFNGNPLLCSCENTWFLRTTTTNSEIPNGPSCTPPATFKANHLLPKDNVISTRQLCESSHLDHNRCLVDHSGESNTRKSPSKCSFGVTKCQFHCPSPCYCYTTFDFTSVNLYCSKSHLTEIPQPFDHSQLNSESEVILWLDGNDFNTINSTDFDDFTNVVQLHLNNSRIQTIHQLAFHNLKVLRVLNLNGNDLQTLPTGVFDNLTLLQELYLSNNKLNQLNDDTFTHFQVLQGLYLHNNQLTKFAVWNLKNQPSLKELTLHYNSWSCDCDFVIKFHEYLNYHNKTVLHAGRVVCINQDGLSMTTSILNFDKSQCEFDDKVKILASAGSVCVLLIISVSLSFYYRRELQLLIYSRRRVLSGVDDSDGKLFDAFVAYSNDDFDFMYNNILPGLEGITNPYRVCVHERDFLAGCVIADNILEAVRISSRTIILLTDNFVRSGWCRFEFKSAHLQMLEDRCPRVLVIVQGRIPANLEPEMKLYLKTNTYLTWGEPFFWQKVYNAMPRQRATGIGVARSPNLMPPEDDIIYENIFNFNEITNAIDV